MVSMTVEQIGIYTIEDLERERGLDERLRWELLDGELVMAPAPRPAHHQVVAALYDRLRPAIRNRAVLYFAPVDLYLDERTVLQPDLVVVDRAQVGEEGLHGAPLLAVEVLSPSSRRNDLVTKLEILQRAGCPHYWVVDPACATLWAWRLVEGRYELQVRAQGDDEVHVTEPVELSLRVGDLLPPG